MWRRCKQPSPFHKPAPVRYTVNAMQKQKWMTRLQQHLQGRPEIVFAILYGSAAEGERFRDLDIGLFVKRTIVPPAHDFDYAFDLAETLQPLLPVPVDVHVINDAPLIFRYNVSRGVPLLVNDEESFIAFLTRTWDDFFDFQPVAMQYMRDLR